MESLYIVMPAYNEQDNIRNVVEQWYPIVDRIGSNSRLVVADSGSTDDTHKVLEKLKNENHDWKFYQTLVSNMDQK